MSSADSPQPETRSVVIGGGIAGLAAAYQLAASGHRVVVIEAADRVGGKLRSAEVGGITVDVGAEAMLNRRPEGVDLAEAVGLDVVHPAMAGSRLWTRGALRPLPRTLMGVPIDVDDLARSGALSPEGLERVRREPILLGDGAGGLVADELPDDMSVGDLVGGRLGDEVVDRLVEPLLGGVYAGRAREISVMAAVPQLMLMARQGSLVEATPAIAAPGVAPVFAGLEGGMGRLPAALAAALNQAGVEVRTSTTVRAVRRRPDGFELTTGPTTNPQVVHAEQVVIATPPPAAGRLLAEVSPVASVEVGAIELASMAVVTLVFRAADLPLDRMDGSGFLVPPMEQRRIKASTFSFNKWAWTREAGAAARTGESEDVLVLRTSIGRHRDETALQVSDEELVANSLCDLRAAVGLSQGAIPVDVGVQRWGGGLPQYAVGHLARVARIRESVARVPGLAVCGAAYDGVGIPAVIASARAAVTGLRR